MRISDWSSDVCSSDLSGILDRSTVPAGLLIRAQAAEAGELARAVAEALDYVGVLTLEFFASENGPVFNEMAPRVHNSDRKSVVSGKSVSVRVDLGCRRIIKKKK